MRRQKRQAPDGRPGRPTEPCDCRPRLRTPVRAAILAISLALVAAACETPSSRFSPVAPLGRTAAAPAAEAPAPDAAGTQTAQERPRGAAEVAEAFRLEGQGAFVNPRRAAETRDGVELAFEDAPVAEVVSALIGDVLGQDFVIDPQVSGRISLRSARL